MDELTSRTQNIETFIITVRFPKNFSQLSSSDQDWESSLEHTSFLSRLMRGRWIPKDLFMLQFDKNIKICLQTMQTNLNLIRNQVMQLSNKKVVQFFESCKNSSWRKNQKNKNKRICYFSKKNWCFLHSCLNQLNQLNQLNKSTIHMIYQHIFEHKSLSYVKYFVHRSNTRSMVSCIAESFAYSFDAV